MLCTYLCTCAQSACMSKSMCHRHTRSDGIIAARRIGRQGKQIDSVLCAYDVQCTCIVTATFTHTGGWGGEACTVPSGAEYPQICYKMVPLRWLPCGPPMTCTALENSHWIVGRQTKARARKTMPYKIDVHSQGCKCDWNEQTSHLTYAAPKY